jgi:hypothetical protein
MTVTAPPEVPQPSYDELEALIEEARRRARRRRLVIAGAIVGALVAAGALAALLWPRSEPSGGSGLREGFRAVQAKGPVQHALVEELRPRMTTISLATGRARPTRVTREVWWDARSGLYRILVRNDGVAVSDWVQRSCFGTGSRHVCIAPSPFDLPSEGVVWQPKPGRARRVGTGTFRGRPVVWVEQVMSPANGRHPLSGNQVAYDAATHRPVALRATLHRPGRAPDLIVDESAVRLLPDLAAKQVSFAVPMGGAPRNFDLHESGWQTARLAGAADALGRTPLWLGQTYRGHRLQFVQTGSTGSENAKGGGAGMAPVVRFDYGVFRIDEYGAARSLWLVNAPRRGTLLRSVDSSFTYGRDGIVVDVTLTGAADSGRRDLIALARALRPAA